MAKQLWYQANGNGWRKSTHQLEKDTYSLKSMHAFVCCRDNEVGAGRWSAKFGYSELNQEERDIVEFDPQRLRAALRERRKCLANKRFQHTRVLVLS